MADSVSYKGFLSLNNEEEVRRFMVDKAVASNYEYLLEKIKTVFPAIRNKLLKISWTDNDGDQVTISSDEDLMIALTEMTGPVYKISIKVKDVIGNDGGDAVHDESQGEVHPGVSCDGCEGPVRGYRYKCLVCQDFDLCSNCERKGLHSGHNMIRMSSAQGTWPHNLFRKINRMQERMEQRAKARTGSEEKQQAGPAGGCGFQNQWGRGGFGCGGGRGRGGGRGMWNRGRGGPMGFGFDPRMWQGFGFGHGYADKETTPEEAAQNAAEAAKAVHEAAHHAANAGAAAAAAAASTFSGASAHEDYLRNVGEMVAAAMDPFGINVDVSVETPDGARTKVSSNSTSATTTSTTTTTTEEKKNDEAANKDQASSEQMDTTEAPEVVNIPITQQDVEKEKKSAENSRESTPDDEEWTIVKEGRKTPEAGSSKQLYPELPATQDASAPAADAAMEDATPVDAAKGNGNPENPPTTAVSQAVEARHPDPKIQVALQAMMNMGFTNEGGWLTTLLEAKQGDIGKVLDLLQPVKK